MPLKTTLGDLIARLRQGRFTNAQAMSQGIVLRVRNGLVWDKLDNMPPKTIVRWAAEYAGLTSGKDLIVEF